MDRLVNNKLRVLYAKFTDEQQITPVDGVGSSIADHDTKARLISEIVRDAEQLVGLVNDLTRIVTKLQTAQSRVDCWCKLWPNPGPSTAHVLQTLADVIPDLITMYSREVSSRRAGLADICEWEHRDVFAAVALSCKFEPFVDDNVLSRLYALVCTEV